MKAGRGPRSDRAAQTTETKAAWLLALAAVLCILLPLWILLELGPGQRSPWAAALCIIMGMALPWTAFGGRGWRAVAVAAVGGGLLAVAMHSGSTFSPWLVYTLGTVLGTILVVVAATATASLRGDARDGFEVGLAGACLWLVAWGIHGVWTFR